ncbi:MAG: hypothetical protein WC509_03335 [Candidatus Izemoplasmatales bacterium]
MILTWSGWEIFFNGLSSLLTLLAIIVSLYIALRKRKANYTCQISSSAINSINQKGFFNISLYNVGEMQLSIEKIGIIINNHFYTNQFQENIKKLIHTIKINEHMNTHFDTQYGEFVLDIGEKSDTPIFIKDYFIVNTKKNKKLFVGYVINGTLKKYYLHIKENVFFKLYDSISVHSRLYDKKKIKSYVINGHNNLTSLTDDESVNA